MQTKRLAVSVLCLGMLITPLASQADEQAVLRNMLEAVQKAQGAVGNGQPVGNKRGVYDERRTAQRDTRDISPSIRQAVPEGEQYFLRPKPQDKRPDHGSRPGVERPQRPDGQQPGMQQPGQGSRPGVERPQRPDGQQPGMQQPGQGSRPGAERPQRPGGQQPGMQQSGQGSRPGMERP